MKLVNLGVPVEEFPHIVVATLLLLGHEGFNFRTLGINMNPSIEEIAVTRTGDPNVLEGSLTTAKITVVECYPWKTFVLEAYWQEYQDGEHGFGSYGLNGPMSEMESFER